MTTPITALGMGPLKWRDILTAPTSPNVGVCNIYNTTIPGPLAPTLPHVGAIGGAGAIMLVGKDLADTTANAVTFSCFSGEFFTDGTTSKTLLVGGQSLLLVAIAVSGVIKWQVWASVGGLGAQSIIAATGTVTLLSAAGLDVIVVASDGAALTLPTAVGSQIKYTVKSLGTVTVGTTSGQTADGSALPVTIVVNDAVTFVPFSGNWVII